MSVCLVSSWQLLAKQLRQELNFQREKWLSSGAICSKDSTAHGNLINGRGIYFCSISQRLSGSLKKYGELTYRTHKSFTCWRDSCAETNASTSTPYLRETKVNPCAPKGKRLTLLTGRTELNENAQN